MNIKDLPVAVIGAGPVGLAAAAHLIERGLTPLILEAGPGVAASFHSTAHVRLFSPWRYNLDRAARELLSKHGWVAPDPEALPTAGEMVRDYLEPLARVPQIASALRLSHRVSAISRVGIDKVKTRGREHAPFSIRVDTPGGEQEIFARAVIDASGTWSQPNPLGADGLPALGEKAFTDRISYGMPDIAGTERARFTGKHVLVVGAGHSAAGSLLALAELAENDPGTKVIWAIRGGDAKSFGGGGADQLPARGQLGHRLKKLKESGALEIHQQFRIHSLNSVDGKIEVRGIEGEGAAPVITGVDEIIAATGARPNHQMVSELRLRLDPWLESTEALAPLIDPNLHSCGTVRAHGHRELAHPESAYYAVGAKSYGRAPNFLMATGYEQVRSVVAALGGDLQSADEVQLELPETGVCGIQANTGTGAGSSTCCGASPVDEIDARPAAAETSSCCGGPAKVSTGACCVRDAEIKQAGGAGCGSTPKGCSPARP